MRLVLVAVVVEPIALELRLVFVVNHLFVLALACHRSLLQQVELLQLVQPSFHQS